MENEELIFFIKMVATDYGKFGNAVVKDQGLKNAIIGSMWVYLRMDLLVYIIGMEKSTTLIIKVM